MDNGRQHGHSPTGITSESPENGAAYANTPFRSSPHKITRRRSGIRDSKRSNAAALAVDLASSTSWSENILPATVRLQDSDLVDTSMDMQNTVALSRDIHSENADLEPPPEYSQYEVRDTAPEIDSSDVDSMRHSRLQPEMSSITHPSYSSSGSGQYDGPEAPLIPQSAHKTNGSRPPWNPRQNATGRQPPNFRQRLIVVTVFLLIMIGGVLGYYHFNHQKPVDQWRTLPLVPTNQTHIHHTTYDHITGRFELRSKLELVTTTGNIDIEIDPQPSSELNHTSTLILNSTTGTINLVISKSWWMRKDRTFPTIYTQINTVTGSVHATVLLGRGGSTSVTTTSGPQNIRVYTYDASTGDPISTLSTSSHIGDQVIAVANFGAWDATIDTLEAHHVSQGTGHIELQYSNHWRGRVHAKASPIGKVEVQGCAGLVFDKEEENEVFAHKGRGEDLKLVDVVSEGLGGVVFKSWYTW